MEVEAQAVDGFEPTYRSSTAARLAGIPVETLRVWERRYGVVGPRLDSHGRRLYTAEDVSRLTLIRKLVASGNPIGAIARLPLAALSDMRSAAAAASRGLSTGRIAGAPPIRVVLVGAGLAELARESAVRWSLEIVATCAAASGAAQELRGVSADILAMELPTLQLDAVAMVDALAQTVGARHVLVTYRFGRAEVVAALREQGHSVVRAPLDPDALEHFCREATMPGALHAAAGAAALVLDAVPGRRFDDQALARLARALTTLHCECPHHVVDLLASLGAFERYSAECANRSPADAALHRYLERVAGSARVLFEDALVRIARAEGLSLPLRTDHAPTEN